MMHPNGGRYMRKWKRKIKTEIENHCVVLPLQTVTPLCFYILISSTWKRLKNSFVKWLVLETKSKWANNERRHRSPAIRPMPLVQMDVCGQIRDQPHKPAPFDHPRNRSSQKKFTHELAERVFKKHFLKKHINLWQLRANPIILAFRRTAKR